MSAVTLKTVKRLFALSKNRCAYPKCYQAIVDNDGTVLGDICHINAAKPKGPRYDKNQTPEARDGYENLVLMCKKHHKLIDANVQKYTSGVLLQYKQLLEDRTVLEITPDEASKSLILFNSYISKIEAQEVNIVLTPGSGIQNNTIIFKNSKKGSTGSVPIAGTISTNNEMRGYVQYLIDRFNEMASKGERKGRVFSYAIIYTNIKKEFGSKWDYLSESRFPDLVAYLQKKISGTEMGRKLRQKSGDMYHSFEEHLKIMR
ncbi:MAG: HNH endonuclease signature motif containing protein [Candidatus Cloacimonadaceae bacterium]|nr:HNH endonuclease signature motif containing protein [Candidatus Cloacimonadaceae bacterium]MDP3115288.1 HNH endonuclease signature motif containing protein [Candidatus Cloacimonadaceae bacterium]